MSQVILKTTLKREKNKLYFCGTSTDGFITINETVMARGRKKSNGKN
jgi:hypothetical protein